MSSILELKRTSQYSNWLRNFRVFFNGIEYEKIANDETIRYELVPGEYELFVKIDWCGSNRYDFTIGENEIIQLECGCPIIGWKLFVQPFIMPYYIFFNTNKYLYIK
ncbi:hypothetical protein M3194_09225 [Paenibacillus glycanilyticus]|uniref:hypothetical protein n=1 Tax=Paenibacillus glycanilyticus TaxID=126569 RepID=UPI00203BDA23|nr:hypothetical protein [Paenibacillus glycanilyticus]MCM3627548.1 hypothetical protein [Paenibacillus glycanilyticus]